VKTPKLLSRSEIFERPKQMDIESEKLKFKESSPEKSLKNSKVKDDGDGLVRLGKRADKIDLLDDTSIPNNIMLETISMSDPNFNR